MDRQKQIRRGAVPDLRLLIWTVVYIADSRVLHPDPPAFQGISDIIRQRQRIVLLPSVPIYRPRITPAVTRINDDTVLLCQNYSPFS